jgi:hypothetical protein
MVADELAEPVNPTYGAQVIVVGPQICIKFLIFSIMSQRIAV